MSRGSFKISLKGEVWRWCPVLYTVTVSHHSCSKGAIAGLPGAPADPASEGKPELGDHPVSCRDTPDKPQKEHN